ncbi:hypothetical protein Tco_1292336 [Tanacetum coccineum]
MSNNKNDLQTQTSSALHNTIMKSGGKDHPLIVPADTPATSGIDGIPPLREEVMETYVTVSEEIKKKIDGEAEVVQIILTRIDNDIYFTIDACPNAMEIMVKVVTLVKQSQKLKTVSYYKLYDILKQHQNKVNEIRAERLARTANPLSLVAATQQPVYYPQPKPTHYTQSSSTRSQVAIINKGKEITKSLPPTYNQEPKVVTDDEASSKEKEIKKLMDLISMSFKKIYKPTNNNLETSSNTRNMNVDNTPRSDRRTGYDRQTRQYDNQRAVNVVVARDNVARECKKAKQVWDSACHKEKMLCKQEEARIQLSSEQAHWRDDTDDEPEDQELKAHYMYMEKIQEVTPDAGDNSGPIFDTESLEKAHNIDDNYNVFANERQHSEQPESVNDTYLAEQGDTNTTLDSSDMSINGGETGHDDQMFQEERELLASLIDQMKFEIDGSKKTNKSLESSNKAL